MGAVDQDAVTDLIKRTQKLRDAAEQAGDITGAGHLSQAIVSLLNATGDVAPAPTSDELAMHKRRLGLEQNPITKRQYETELCLALARRDRRRLSLKTRK